MKTSLPESLLQTALGQEADEILRTCVHCGFCNATCPTYQLTGDELDGPRGRIYLIKQALEGQPASRRTRIHLDRCLTCRACETTCPSGVDYHHLLDTGRERIEQRVPRPVLQRLLRWSLRRVMTSPRAFAMLYRTGRAIRPALPQVLRRSLALRPQHAAAHPDRQHPRRMLLLEGCVQA
ncbi:MAG: 4Fe-4S dicluster domain-containing protein, partial [Gammaproteobacteria bacterium]